jgi:hypothetical protein
MNFNFNLGIDLAQALNQVVGERVVVIYHDDHSRSFSRFKPQRILFEDSPVSV